MKSRTYLEVLRPATFRPSPAALVGGGLVIAAGAIALAARYRRRFSFRGRVVVITGGSRGLGLELARSWGEEGATVVFCARTGADVQRAVYELRSNGFDAHGYVCDIRIKAEVDQFVEWTCQQWGRIDVLVNNAGIIQAGPERNMTLDDYRDAMDTHFYGPLYLMEAVAPGMCQRGEGRIVNIASIGGEVPVPHLLPYCASKFALVGLSEGMATELASKGVYVTTVCPGLMRTGSPRNASFKGQHRKEYAWFSISDSLPVVTTSSSRAARLIISACRYGRPYLAITLASKAATRLRALFPGTYINAMRIVNHWLPAATNSDQRAYLGKDSFSEWSPSALTYLTEQAAVANNEIR